MMLVPQYVTLFPAAAASGGGGGGGGGGGAIVAELSTGIHSCRWNAVADQKSSNDDDDDDDEYDPTAVACLMSIDLPPTSAAVIVPTAFVLELQVNTKLFPEMLQCGRRPISAFVAFGQWCDDDAGADLQQFEYIQQSRVYSISKDRIEFSAGGLLGCLEMSSNAGWCGGGGGGGGGGKITIGMPLVVGLRRCSDADAAGLSSRR